MTVATLSGRRERVLREQEYSTMPRLAGGARGHPGKRSSLVGPGETERIE